jgi:hypothetical protein
MQYNISVKHKLAFLIPLFGIAVSTYLLFLKLYPQPCFGGFSCERVLFSPYGSLGPIPVSVFALLFWAAYLYCTKWQLQLRVVATLASLAFMGIQFFVIQGFCIYCTLHAAIVLLLWCFAVDTKIQIYPFGLILGTLFFYATSSDNPVIAPNLFPQQEAVGFSWLSPQSPGSAVLVLAIDCPKCHDELAKLWSAERAPRIVFRETPENRTATEIFVAAVLAQPKPDDAFPLIWSVWAPLYTLSHSDQLFAQRLSMQHLPYQTHQTQARTLLRQQQIWLDHRNIFSTPTTVRP